MKFQDLRKKYPQFVYEKYSYKVKPFKVLTQSGSYRISKNNLEILFSFKIKPRISFEPKIIIENIDKSRIKKIDRGVLENLIFHLGLIEIPSYWKATCSPEIKILAGFLNKEQIKWWKGLIINGMGQFFYENKISWRAKNFLKITSNKNKKYASSVYLPTRQNRYLVPFAGGRDSIVTLERLKKSASWRKNIALFLVNPNEQIQKVAKVSGVKKQIIVKRIIDRKLLELNKKGYLNGHTPFTAVLSFLAVFCAVLFDYKNIVFSNEKSAEEGNVKYLGKIINHQWAKSSKFEKMFKDYCKKYLAKNINYFSFLRKYTELEISKMLTKYPQYFSVFSSCNASMKIGAKQIRTSLRENLASSLRSEIRWCGNCPKCLFVYLTLYPFLEKKELLKIFSKDIFANKQLLPVMKALLGTTKAKPFECVGTKKESRLAFKLCLKKSLRQAQGKPIPYLLTPTFLKKVVG